MESPPRPSTAVNTTSTDDTLDRWLAAASERYLADLTMPELTRALRALSSCYVERRSQARIGAGPCQRRQTRGVRALLRAAALHHRRSDRARAVALGRRRTVRKTSPLADHAGPGMRDRSGRRGVGPGNRRRARGRLRHQPLGRPRGPLELQRDGPSGIDASRADRSGPLEEGAGRHDRGVRPERARRRDARSRPPGAVPGRARRTSRAAGRTDRSRGGPLVGRLAPGSAGRGWPRRRVAIQSGIARIAADAWTGPPASITAS